ncbi:cellulase family glycosylhydrolase [Antrihabitans cavernicola]|uniref:Cellulase family glycosylhydrolase n=1 Tax=Antrihabitans cavernicola TaxID=2495913 RepID=A0A5A7SGS5_9NOCA|nr:cellulase family glycosylhydrolase [Spelaeibacter cavernicola]KAA0023853.1 cellulase family glycosylhydrolase [Spelaeibacter cavernicola]
MNINPGKQHFYTPSVWAGLWQTWDWSTWIKPMVDDSKSAGANAIRLIGNTHVVTSGMITQQQYMDRWKQLLDYATEQDLYVFPCGGDLGHWGSATTWAKAEALYSSWAKLLSSYAPVIGVDITNEASAQYSSAYVTTYNQPEKWQDTIKHLGEVVRSISGKPITHSRSIDKVGVWCNGSIYTDLLSDFISIHCYYTPDPSDAQRLSSTDWGRNKELLIGEFGIAMNSAPADRIARYDGVKRLVKGADGCVGALAWSGYDLDDHPENQFGLFDADRRGREDILSQYRTFPVLR